MATQLNIKDPETVRLARDLAARSGRTVTAVVRSALERDAAERADRDRQREAEIAEKVAHMMELLEGSKDWLEPEWRDKTSKEIMDSIYDDDEPDGFAR